MGETDTEGLENQSGGWVKGSGKGHNKEKKSPPIILCCPHPNISIQIQFIIAFASRFEVRRDYA